MGKEEPVVVSNTDDPCGGGQERCDSQRLDYTTNREGAWTKKQANLIVSNTDEGKRDAQTRVEGNRLIVSNTDELGGGGYERSPSREA